VAKPVLRHRLLLKPGAEVDGFTPDDVLDDILTRTEVPR
jgi:MoxR-like ATPase